MFIVLNIGNMMKINKKILIISAYLTCLSSVGFAVEALSYSKDDWQVDCDNTRTCRVTGYVNDNDVTFDDVGASILLVIEPGKNSKIYGFVRTIEEYKSPLALYINDKNFGNLQISPKSNDEFILSGEQIDRLLNSKTIESIKLWNKNQVLNISANGMTAVFLKVDEFQNRLNTPLAIIKKGNKTVNQLKPYVEPPVIKMGRVIQDQSVIDSVTQNIAKFYPYLEQQLSVDYDLDAICWSYSKEDLAEVKQSIKIYGLNENQALISHQCWRAAYNEGDMYWLVDKSLDTIKQVEGTYTSFDAGFLGLFMKARGIGDCLYFESAVWDGKKFQKSGETSTGMCRGAAGGFWDIPLYVTEIKLYDNQ